MHLYESLLGMGFPKGGACESLRQSNNDITAALEVGLLFRMFQKGDLVFNSY